MNENINEAKVVLLREKQELAEMCSLYADRVEHYENDAQDARETLLAIQGKLADVTLALDKL